MGTVNPLLRWARDTWRSFEAMTYADSGLPADSVGTDLAPSSRSDRTSITNIGGYLGALVAARDLRIISAAQCQSRAKAALHTLASMRRHPPSGLFYTWYAAGSGELLRTGRRGRRAQPFVSSVDNGWLAAALMVVREAIPQLRADIDPILDPMDFGACYGSERGILRGGFWEKRTRRHTDPFDYRGRVLQGTPHHYDMLNSETRVAAYVGIVREQLPAGLIDRLEAPLRSWRGREVVVTFGGSMFEALAPDLLVPEATWAPETWGRNHADTVTVQRDCALAEGWEYWGFSPCAVPGGGYREFGVPAIAWKGRGYPSTWRGEPIITPHASMLALPFARESALDNLHRIEHDLGAYGPGGFPDSVGVTTGRHTERYLAVDQSMALIALAGATAEVVRHGYFVTDEVETVLRPIIERRAGFPGSRRPDQGASRASSSARVG